MSIPFSDFSDYANSASVYFSGCYIEYRLLIDVGVMAKYKSLMNGAAS